MPWAKPAAKANIENNLHPVGIQLSDEDLKKVTQRIMNWAIKKKVVTQSDLPYILSDVLRQRCHSRESNG
jgi:D-citramalate synthase